MFAAVVGDNGGGGGSSLGCCSDIADNANEATILLLLLFIVGVGASSSSSFSSTCFGCVAACKANATTGDMEEGGCDSVEFGIAANAKFCIMGEWSLLNSNLISLESTTWLTTDFSSAFFVWFAANNANDSTDDACCFLLIIFCIASFNDFVT